MRKTIERLTTLAAGAALAWAFAASAATFNLFSPANGILVGNPNTYVTTAATSSNVRALWSGTCNSGTFLRGDGSCVAVAGATFPLLAPDGDETAPSYAFASDSNSGLWHDMSDNEIVLSVDSQNGSLLSLTKPGFVLENAESGSTGAIHADALLRLLSNTEVRTDVNGGAAELSITDGAVGFIGTTVVNQSSAALGVDVYSDYSVASNLSNITSTTYGVSAGGTFHANHANGTRASPTATLSGDITGGIGSRAYQSGGAFQLSSPASIHWQATQDQTATDYGMWIRLLTTPKNTTTRQERGGVTDNGTLWIHGTGTYNALSNAQTLPVTDAKFVASGAGNDPAGASFVAVTYDGSSGTAGFRGMSSRGSPASPSASQADDLLAFLGAHGYGATGFSSGSRALVGEYAAQNWTDSAQGTYIAFGTTANNTTSRVERMRIAQDGEITLNGVAASDFARLSQANTFTNFQTINTTGSTGRYQINISGTRRGFLHAAQSANDFCQATAANDVCLGAAAGAVALTTDDGATQAAKFTGSAATSTIAGITVSDFARQSQANTFTATQAVSAASAQLNLIETGATTNEGGWQLRADNDELNLYTLLDNGSASDSVFAVARSGADITSLALNPFGTLSEVSAAGVSFSDFARLSQSNTFTGAEQHISNSGSPLYRVTDTTDSASVYLQVGGGEAYVGTQTAHPFNIVTNNTNRISVSSSGTITGNGVDMTPASGTFTATFDDAGTTSPTVDFDYQKMGNIVSIVARTNAATFTSDSTNFATTGAPVPAAIRPSGTAALTGIISGATNNGTATAFCMEISTAGNITLYPFPTGLGNVCASASWTNTGNKALSMTGVNFTYMLGNP